MIATLVKGFARNAMTFAIATHGTRTISAVQNLNVNAAFLGATVRACHNHPMLLLLAGTVAATTAIGRRR
jgi:hypothetical protein